MKFAKLFSCMYGSSLFGTRTPTSDTDWKHIVLPDVEELLLGHEISNKVKKTNEAWNVSNGADDVDEEFVPLQIFARDFFAGQTYAIELAFSIDGSHADQTFWTNETAMKRSTNPSKVEALPFFLFVRELREKYLTSEIRTLVGYVANQAHVYSMKGERLHVVKKVSEIFQEFLASHSDKARVSELHDAFSKELEAISAEYPKYFSITEYDSGEGNMLPCLKLHDRTLPFATAASFSFKAVKGLEKSYGQRAARAEKETADWKAMMHAIRIADEGIELMTNKKLSFPLPKERVERLLSIKRGEVPLDVLREELDSKLDILRDLEKASDLPSRSDEITAEFTKWLLAWLRKFYAHSL